MTGEKKRLLVIGKSKVPWCLKKVKKLPADYTASAKAWMTKDLFSDWLTKWDQSLDRNVLLLIDNCTAHNVDLNLKHIRIELRRGVQSLADNFDIQYKYESFVNALLRDNQKQATIIDSYFTTK